MGMLSSVFVTKVWHKFLYDNNAVRKVGRSLPHKLVLTILNCLSKSHNFLNNPLLTLSIKLASDGSLSSCINVV